MEVTSKRTIPAKTLTALCKQLKKECEGNFALFAYVNDAGGSNIQANEQVAQEHINVFFPKTLLADSNWQDEYDVKLELLRCAKEYVKEQISLFEKGVQLFAKIPTPLNKYTQALNTLEKTFKRLKGIAKDTNCGVHFYTGSDVNTYKNNPIQYNSKGQIGLGILKTQSNLPTASMLEFKKRAIINEFVEATNSIVQSEYKEYYDQWQKFKKALYPFLQLLEDKNNPLQLHADRSLSNALDLYEYFTSLSNYQHTYKNLQIEICTLNILLESVDALQDSTTNAAEEHRLSVENAKREAEAEAKRKAAEEEAKRKAEEEARRRAEEEKARRRAEEEARRRAEEEARRKAEEEARHSEQREFFSQLNKGQVLEGTVKAVMPYGVSVDLGGVDGLIHITDLSWGRVSNPSEIVKEGDKINVVILDFDDEKKRIALGLKQLTPHPWEALNADIKVGDKISGKVVVMADYGAFVEVAPGVEGLIHVSEMSWSQHLRSANDFLKVGQEVEAVILTLDRDERKMSLGLKQLTVDPWENIDSKYAVGSKHIAKICSTKLRIHLELEYGIEGDMDLGDIFWTLPSYSMCEEIFKQNDEIEVVVLDINYEKRELKLGHKQLYSNPWVGYEDLFNDEQIAEKFNTIIDKYQANINDTTISPIDYYWILACMNLHRTHFSDRIKFRTAARNIFEKVYENLTEYVKSSIHSEQSMVKCQNSLFGKAVCVVPKFVRDLYVLVELEDLFIEQKKLGSKYNDFSTTKLRLL